MLSSCEKKAHRSLSSTLHPTLARWPGLVLLLLAGGLLLFTAHQIGRRMALPKTEESALLQNTDDLIGSEESPSAMLANTGTDLLIAPPVDPSAPPLALCFPDRSVTMEILPVGMDTAGRMDTPDAHDQAAWYREGPSPGEEGNALISGHKVWKGQRGCFSLLPQLERGEPVVFFHQDGSIRVFYVDMVITYPVEGVPSSIMDVNQDARVTLITCAGSFDRQLGTSRYRCVAVCKVEDWMENFDPNWRYLPEEILLSSAG